MSLGQNQQLQEAAEVRRMFGEWTNNLVVAGVPAGTIASAGLLALVEVMLIEVGTGPTVLWLRSFADQVERNGDEMLGELREG